MILALQPLVDQACDDAISFRLIAVVLVQAACRSRSRDDQPSSPAVRVNPRQDGRYAQCQLGTTFPVRHEAVLSGIAVTDVPTGLVWS